jgi:hypothetical protein
MGRQVGASTGHHGQPAIDDRFDHGPQEDPRSEYLLGPGDDRPSDRSRGRRRTIILAAAIALVAGLTSGGIVYVLSGRPAPAGAGGPATSTAPSGNPQEAKDPGAGGTSAPSKGDASSGTGGQGEPSAGAGTGGAGSGGSGGSTGGNAPVTAKKKPGQVQNAGGSGGQGGTQDTSGPQPDGAAGLVEPVQPAPGQGVGGPPYLNQPSDGEAAPAGGG